MATSPRPMSLVRLNDEQTAKIRDKRTLRSHPLSRWVPNAILTKRQLLFLGEIPNNPGSGVLYDLNYQSMHVVLTHLFVEMTEEEL